MCGSNAFQDYFDDAKDSSLESRVKQVPRIKKSFNQSNYFDDAKDSSLESRVKQVPRIKELFNQESRFK